MAPKSSWGLEGKKGVNRAGRYLSRTTFFWSSPHKRNDAISWLVPIFPVRLQGESYHPVLNPHPELYRKFLFFHPVPCPCPKISVSEYKHYRCLRPGRGGFTEKAHSLHGRDWVCHQFPQGRGQGPGSLWGEVEGAGGSQGPQRSRHVLVELPPPGDCCFPGVLATKFRAVPQQLIISSRRK